MPSLLGPPFKSFLVQKRQRVCQQKVQGLEHFLLHHCLHSLGGTFWASGSKTNHTASLWRGHVCGLCYFLKQSKPRLRNVNSCMLQKCCLLSYQACTIMYDCQMDQADPESKWLRYRHIFHTFSKRCSLNCSSHGRYVNTTKMARASSRGYECSKLWTSSPQ